MRALLLVAVLALAAGCSGPESTSPGVDATVNPAVTGTSGGSGDGCGTTPVELGALPDWTASALVSGLPHVRSREGNLVGVLFVSPLAAPPRQGGPNNKILWISKAPRDGARLTLTLTPLHGGASVTTTEPASSTPGEIYPSIVDVPAAGCWRVDATWGSNRATLELAYRAE
jgi:hypothetical protein